MKKTTRAAATRAANPAPTSGPRERVRPGERIMRTHRQAGSALQAFRDIAKRAGPLDPQTCELILMACFAINGHEEPFKNHALRALEAGLPKEALQHLAILPLGAATVIPQVAQVLRWIDDVDEQYRAGSK